MEIISGNGWGGIGRPLSEEYGYPFFFFVSNIFVVVYGLLNLIVAAIVDSNLAAREEDVQGQARLAIYPPSLKKGGTLEIH